MVLGEHSTYLESTAKEDNYRDTPFQPWAKPPSHIYKAWPPPSGSFGVFLTGKCQIFDSVWQTWIWPSCKHLPVTFSPVHKYGPDARWTFNHTLTAEICIYLALEDITLTPGDLSQGSCCSCSRSPRLTHKVLQYVWRRDKAGSVYNSTWCVLYSLLSLTFLPIGYVKIFAFRQPCPCPPRDIAPSRVNHATQQTNRIVLDSFTRWKNPC